MSPSPIIKASWKEHKGNKNVYFSPFWGSVWWKKEWDSDKSKTVTVGELSKLTNNGVVLIWKKKIYQIWFCLFYLYISIIKVNIISKLVLATDNVMYVHSVYLDCSRDVQRSKTKKSKHTIKQRKKCIDKIIIIIIIIIIVLNGSHLYIRFAWKIKRFIDTVCYGFDRKNNKEM